jgi:P-type conjugative transfer protein TrbG
MQLASRIDSRSPSLRSEYPLTDDQIQRVAPSIFADAPHESRSQRYAYIPAAAVLAELRKEGFQPFMVTQTRVRDEGKREHTKHMLRLRHASQINGAEANEIVLLKSHDGTSSYQMQAGMFRFVCSNGLVCGDTVADVRVPHRGDVSGHVIQGAYEVLRGFDRVKESRDAMRSITLDEGEAEVFARSALALKYPADSKPAPITESQILMPRRLDDRRPDLWSVFNRTQENLTKGGLHGRSANGRRQQTRPVQGIDSDVRLSRALWMLADGLVLVKPTRSGLKTNLVITTSRRTYLLELTSTEKAWMASVSWDYPKDRMLALQRQSQAAQTAAPVDTGLALEKIRFRYAVSGSNPPWKPQRAFDDGGKVYIQFPPGIAQGELPPLFVIGAQGDGQLVNYRFRSPYYIVDRLLGAAELRLGGDGGDVVRIERTDGVARRN